MTLNRAVVVVFVVGVSWWSIPGVGRTDVYRSGMVDSIAFAR